MCWQSNLLLQPRFYSTSGFFYWNVCFYKCGSLLYQPSHQCIWLWIWSTRQRWLSDVHSVVMQITGKIPVSPPDVEVNIPNLQRTSYSLSLHSAECASVLVRRGAKTQQLNIICRNVRMIYIKMYELFPLLPMHSQSTSFIVIFCSIAVIRFDIFAPMGILLPSPQLFQQLFVGSWPSCISQQGKCLDPVESIVCVHPPPLVRWLTSSGFKAFTSTFFEWIGCHMDVIKITKCV